MPQAIENVLVVCYKRLPCACKALWQKHGADWAKAAEDGASPSAGIAEPKTARAPEPPPSMPSPLREDFPAQWRSILEDVIRRSKCLCEQTKAETDTKLGDLEAKLRNCMKGLLDEQLKINQRTSQEASEAQETGQLSAELVKAAEAKFKRGLEWSLLSVRSEFQRDLENLRETQQKVLSQVQQTLASMSGDMEIAATSSARLGKSVKKVEDKVQDLSVSVVQHQADIDELRAETSTLARTNKRVDDLWRQVEGVRLERSTKDSRAETLAQSQGRSFYGQPGADLPPSPPTQPQPPCRDRRVCD